MTAEEETIIVVLAAARKIPIPTEGTMYFSLLEGLTEEDGGGVSRDGDRSRSTWSGEVDEGSSLSLLFLLLLLLSLMFVSAVAIVLALLLRDDDTWSRLSALFERRSGVLSVEVLSNVMMSVLGVQ